MQDEGGGGQVQAPQAVRIVLVYEDTATGLRARESVDAMSHQLRLDADLRIRLWRLDLLGIAGVREQVAIEAAAAHVIILSLHGNGDLPVEVRGWLESWLRHKEERAYAIGVLLDPPAVTQQRANWVIAYMRQIADSAGADLFCSVGEAFETGVQTVGTGALGVPPVSPQSRGGAAPISNRSHIGG